MERNRARIRHLSPLGTGPPMPPHSSGQSGTAEMYAGSLGQTRLTSDVPTRWSYTSTLAMVARSHADVAPLCIPVG